MTIPKFAIVEPAPPATSWILVPTTPCYMVGSDGRAFEFSAYGGDLNWPITQPGCEQVAAFMEGHGVQVTPRTLVEVLDMARGRTPDTLTAEIPDEVTSLRRQLEAEKAAHRATERLAEKAARGADKMLRWSMEQSGAMRTVRATLLMIANGTVEDPAARVAQVLAQLDERPGDPLLSELLNVLVDALGNGHFVEPDEYVIPADHATSLTIHLKALGVMLG